MEEEDEVVGVEYDETHRIPLHQGQIIRQGNQRRLLNRVTSGRARG